MTSCTDHLQRDPLDSLPFYGESFAESHNSGRLEVPHGCPTFLRWLLWVVASFYVVVFLVIASLRLTYPYALEWGEGGMLDHVYRILQGQPLYVAPSLWFTPFTYTPFYFYLAAGLSKMIGVSFVPLRLLSLIAALGCCYLIGAIVDKETHCRQCAYLSAAVFAATYPLSGAFFDVGRVDSMLLCFLLGGLYLFRFPRHPHHELLAAVLFFIAFWIKQTALVITLPFVFYSLLPSQRRYRWPFVAIFMTLLFSALIFMQWWTDGWFFYYIFYLPKLHPLKLVHAYHFIQGYLIKPLPIAVTIGAVFLLQKSDQAQAPRRLFWLIAAMAFIGGSLLAIIPFGGYHNVAMPALAMTAILGGIGWHGLEWAATHSRRSALTALLWLLLFVQFLALSYNPLRQLPTAADRAAGDALVKKIREAEGPVFLPSHNYLLPLAGQSSCAHLLAVEDALRDCQNVKGIDLHRMVKHAIALRTFATIVLDRPWFIDEIQEHYTYRGAVFADSSVFWPVTGFRTRPEMIFTRKAK